MAGYRWLVAAVLAAGTVAGAQEQQAEPFDAAEAPEAKRIILVEEIGTGGKDLRVGEKDVFRVVSSAERQVRMEIAAAEGSTGVPRLLVTPPAEPRYLLRIQFVPDPEIGGKLVTLEEMKRQVQSDAADYSDVASEKELKHRTLKYGGRSACYATLTDSRLVGVPNPRPNDFRHVAVGVVRVSEETVLRFQIFTNDLASRDFFGPLDFVMSFVKTVPATTPAPAPAPGNR